MPYLVIKHSENLLIAFETYNTFLILSAEAERRINNNNSVCFLLAAVLQRKFGLFQR